MVEWSAQDLEGLLGHAVLQGQPLYIRMDCIQAFSLFPLGEHSHSCVKCFYQGVQRFTPLYPGRNLSPCTRCFLLWEEGHFPCKEICMQCSVGYILDVSSGDGNGILFRFADYLLAAPPMEGGLAFLTRRVCLRTYVFMCLHSGGYKLFEILNFGQGIGQDLNALHSLFMSDWQVDWCIL